MAFGDFFSNDFETREKASNPKLVTRNYKGDYNKVKDAVCAACKQLNLQVEEINEQYKEIRADNRHQEMIINIYSVSYFHQAIDVKVNTNYFISAGRGLKLIQAFYEILDKNLTKMDGNN